MDGAELREMQGSDIDFVINYFHSASPEFLNGMGADPNKLPSIEEWRKLLLGQLKKPLTSKEFYYIIWIIDQEPFAHSNINGIKYGKEAYMHLHIWDGSKRRKGMGEYAPGTGLSLGEENLISWCGGSESCVGM